MTPVVRTLVELPGLRIGEFHCRPDNERWRHENDIGDGHHVVFPGTAVRITQDGRAPVVTTRNHVVFYRERQRYRRELVSPDGDHCVFAVVGDALLREALADVGAPHDTPDPFPWTHGPVDARTYGSVRLLVDHLVTSPTPDPLLVHETFVTALRRVLVEAVRLHGGGARPSRPETLDAHRETANAVGELLARDPTADLTLEDIAASVHSSPYHLARLFRRHTGYSIHAYRTQLRLRMALEEIVGGGTNLAEVAVAHGFASHSHFTTAFAREFGVPPSAVRSAGPEQVRSFVEA